MPEEEGDRGSALQPPSESGDPRNPALPWARHAVPAPYCPTGGAALGGTLSAADQT
jgi:hypothetical protein